MKRTIFIGSYCPEQYVYYLLENNSSPDFAGINLQSAILNGFKLNSTSVEAFVTPFSLSYPSSNLKRLKSENIGFGKQLLHIIGYCNLPIIKLFAKYYNLKKNLKYHLKRTVDKPNVFLYSLQSPHLLAIVANRKYIGNICVMVTDLPQFMSDNRNPIYLVAKWLDSKIISFCLKEINCYVLLSDKMSEYLPIKNKPYIVIEGIYSNEMTENETQRNSKNIIMYAGGISVRYNVFDLIQAFKEAQIPDAELWLCGPTDDKEMLDKYCLEDQRIKYLGILPNNEIRKLQQQASLLVNPRFGNDEYTKYSFPSKTLEYMASGTPTLMCHLPSLPSEYDDFLYFIETENVIGIKAALENIFSILVEERLEKATKARNFILTKKSDKTQTSKILQLINQL